jgi:DDE family transposase
MPAKSTVPEEFALLVDCFAALTDPRRARGKVHPLPGVLALVVLGLLAGCRSLSAISRFGTIHPEVVAPLGLRRSPSVATLHRLLGMVTVPEVREVVRAFAGDLIARRGMAGAVTEVALDGKTLRGTHEDETPLHVLRAFAQHARLALDQAPAAPLHGEVTAAATWVTDLAGTFPGLAILTGDALFAEQSLCAAIVADQRDDVFRLKKTNQPCSPISRSFAPSPARPMS